MATTRRGLVADATSRLAVAGVESPAHDAEVLLAHVLGIERGRLAMVEAVADPAAGEYAELVERRADREPLQHLTGVAYFRHVELRVGPGVFVPRPETELLVGWAIQAASAIEHPVMVDLCTGSGAIAKALADEVPHARLHAVELGESAHAWAVGNLVGTGVDLRQGDFVAAFEDLLGEVDVVVCNPPYIPLEAWESVAVEARDHDPHLALFSGGDGLEVIRRVAARAALLLRPGGVVGVEHADAQEVSAPAVFAADPRWTSVRDHRDLAGRPRFVTARLAR